MVERSKAEVFDEFTGIVDSVVVEESEVNGEQQKQYHLTISAQDVEVKGTTGKMHEWIKISPKATDMTVPEGSVLDKFLIELELIDKDVRKMSSHTEAMTSMVGNKFKFVQKKLGRSFGGYEAKNYWTPVNKL